MYSLDEILLRLVYKAVKSTVLLPQYHSYPSVKLPVSVDAGLHLYTCSWNFFYSFFFFKRYCLERNPSLSSPRRSECLCDTSVIHRKPLKTAESAAETERGPRRNNRWKELKITAQSVKGAVMLLYRYHHRGSQHFRGLGYIYKKK